MERGRKKKAGCLSFLTPQKGNRRKKRKPDPGAPIDIGASGSMEIPGGLAGIRARMAEMGHVTNAPAAPSMMSEGFDDAPDGSDAAPAGPNAPNAHQETMEGEGFVLMSDFCTENGQQAAYQKLAPARQTAAPRAKAATSKDPELPVSRLPRHDLSLSAPTHTNAQEATPDVLERKNDDGTEMTIEQLLDSFMRPPSPHTSSKSSITAAAHAVKAKTSGSDVLTSLVTADGWCMLCVCTYTRSRTHTHTHTHITNLRTQDERILHTYIHTPHLQTQKHTHALIPSLPGSLIYIYIYIHIYI